MEWRWIEQDQELGEVTGYRDDGLEFEDYLFVTSDQDSSSLETSAISPLYKETSDGQWQKMDMWLEIGSAGAILCSRITILESAAKDRYWRTPIKQVASKVYGQVMVERLIAKWTKKKERDGWVEDRDAPAPLSEPLLLHHYDQHADKMKYPALIEPKMNGIRATWREHEGMLHSRKRNPFDRVPYIVEECKRLEMDVDGELWDPMKDLEDVVSAVKGEHGKVYFYLFELPSDVPRYDERMAALIKKVQEGNFKYIKVVQCALVENAEQAEAYFQILKDMDGCDGATLTSLECPYEWNKRSYLKLKMKDLIHEEYRLTEMVYDEHDEHGYMAKFVFACDKTGLDFLYVPDMGHEERAKVYEDYTRNPSAYVGSMWTLEFREYTKKGLPRHIISSTRRDYE